MRQFLPYPVMGNFSTLNGSGFVVAFTQVGRDPGW